jgi:hypothetical protein
LQPYPVNPVDPVQEKLKGASVGKTDMAYLAKRGRMTQRIEGLKLEDADGRTAAVFEAQAKKWGAPLINHRVYAKSPEIFRAVRGMWAGLDKSGLLPGTLVAMVNRRVAFHNQCPF